MLKLIKRHACAGVPKLSGSIYVLCSCAIVSCSGVDAESADVVVIGGGASGTSAAIQAARLGASVIVVEETPWLGGMLTGAGVTAVDGNKRMPAGLFGEFRDRLSAHYGGLDSLNTGWVSSVLFEPSVGDSIFKSMIGAEESVNVMYNTVLDSLVQGDDRSWTVYVSDSNGKQKVLNARVVIDGTELGDVAAMTGVSYDLGMESRNVTGEDVAPDAPNNIVQDITMVATLKDYGRDVTIAMPEGYDPDEFACTCVNPHCVNPKEPDRMWSPQMMITYGKLPNGKYMINWPIEGNDYYVNLVEMTREQRDSAIADAKAHTMRYIYFMQTELGYNTLGLADDEYPTEDLLPFIPYHRESRRIHGKVRFDLNHIMTPYETAQPLYRTCIAVGDYPVDHHHQAYSGAEDLPNLYFHPVPSYGLPLGVIMPDEKENLLVTEKSISVSNIANGTTRLQPIVMQIGQAAGAVAALAVKGGKPTSEVDVREVQGVILNAGGYLMPFLDVDKGDDRFKAFQRVGASGILRGEGRSVNWSNETWLRADEPLKGEELADFVSFYDIDVPDGLPEGDVNVATVADYIANALGVQTDEAMSAMIEAGVDKSTDEVVTRGEFAIVVDKILDPFSTRNVSLTGEFIEM